MRAITSSRAENLSIGELSKRSGVNIETIRYYERVKMLVAPPRTASGRRVYDSTALRILVFIRQSRDRDACPLRVTQPGSEGDLTMCSLRWSSSKFPC